VKIMKKKGKVALLAILLSAVTLTACGSEEKEIVAKAKEDFNVLYSYEEDKIRPVLEEDKTPKELAREYLIGSLGMDDEDPKYSERGIVKGQGVFVESGIYDGSTIPNVAALSKEEAKKVNAQKGDVFAEEKKDEFEELEEERQKILDEQYAKDNTESERIEEEIKRKSKEILQDRGELPEDSDEEEMEFEIEE